MKLSEAIMAGSVLVSAAPSVLETCALGMALKACSAERVEYCEIVKIWPWAGDRVVIPCGCYVGVYCAYTVIAHIFDHHVCDVRNWTLEQLCDWVKTVEPAEDVVSARVLGERDHAQIREVPDSQEGRAELLRVGAKGTRP